MRARARTERTGSRDSTRPRAVPIVELLSYGNDNDMCIIRVGLKSKRRIDKKKKKHETEGKHTAFGRTLNRCCVRFEIHSRFLVEHRCSDKILTTARDK